MVLSLFSSYICDNVSLSLKNKCNTVCVRMFFLIHKEVTNPFFKIPLKNTMLQCSKHTDPQVKA